MLTSIILCPGGLTSLCGETVLPTGLLTQQLAAGKKPHHNQFQPFLAKSGIALQEVPTCFGSPPNQLDLPWQLMPGVKELGESLQYCFDDGTVITAREILYHPYSLRLPSQLLPLLSRIRPHVLHTPWIKYLSREIVPEWGTLHNVEQCLISILFEAHAASKTLWFANSTDREMVRPVCPIQEIGVLPKLGSHWQLVAPTAKNHTGSGLAHLSFKEVPSEKGGFIFENFEINPIKKTFYFHSYLRFVEFGNQPLGRGLEFDLKGHQAIQKTVREIDQKLVQHGFEPIVRNVETTIPESEITFQIHLERSGRLSFLREFDLRESQGKTRVWNLPAIAETFVRGLDGGIGATTPKDHRLYAQDRKGHRRDRDLKILKHSGAFALILIETLCYILKKKSFEGKALPTQDDFFKLLFDRLGILLFEIERKAGFIELTPAPSLDRLCSKTVVELIRKTVLEWISEFELNQESIFIASGEIQLVGGVRAVFQFFQVLLTRIAIQSRGHCFLKLRAGVFPQFVENLKATSLSELWVGVGPDGAQLYNPTDQWLTSQQTLHAILPLRNFGIQLYYDGMPLNEMDIRDFAPEFNLVENTEEAVPGQPIDWFELHPKFFFKGVEIGGKNLERLSQEGVLEFQGKIYLIQNKNLPSVRRLEAFWSKIQGTQPVNTRRKANETFLHLPKSQTLEILALRTSGVKVKGGMRWDEICQFYDSLDQPREPIQTPPSLKADLKPYQKSGVRWLLDLYRLGLGGILADDMGLGKTIQTLAFLECLRTEGKMGAVLIVVPTSLTYNWMSESARFTPELPIKTFQSKSKTDITDFSEKHKQFAVVSTYGLFTEHQEFFESQKWNILVFDEAQNLKNITAKRTTASRSVSARFKVCLTGTPLENHLGEFYSLLDLAVSGSLGDLSEFREKFVNPDVLDAAEVRYLKLKSKPLVLRRTKAEILKELPLKVESTIKLPFELKQEKIYRDIALSWNEKVKDAIMSQGEARSQILMLTALLRLRQACSDPGSIPNIRYTEEPPKITVLLEALEEITESGQSALVFTQFLHTFDRIKKEMLRHKIESYSLHGGTSRPERERILQEFQNQPKGSVLLMTLKTGGVGLNLVKASYVFHLEPWWNPAVENQATDRAHRIGQDKPVQVYRYLMKESVEEKIEILKDRKSARFNALFSSTETDREIDLSDARLSQSDFEYLLS